MYSGPGKEGAQRHLVERIYHPNIRRGGAERGGDYSNKRAKTNDVMLTRTTSCAEASGRLMSACTATIVISAPPPPCAPLCEALRRREDSFLAESRELLPVRQ